MASLLGQAAGPADQYENVNALLGGHGGLPLSWPMRPGQGQVDELQKLGINLPDIQKNILFPQLAASHPLLGGMAEGAVLGAALTPGPQGPEGVGGGISRAAQGIMAVPAFHRQMAVAQMMAPFQMAGHIQELQAAKAEQHFRQTYEQHLEAQSKHYEDLAEKYQNDEALKKTVEEMKQEGRDPRFIQDAVTGQTTMVIRDPNHPMGWRAMDVASLTGGSGQVNQAGKAIAQPKGGKSSMMFGPGMSVDKLAANALLVQSMPDKFSGEDRTASQNILRHVMGYKGNVAAVSGQGGEQGRIAGGVLPPAREKYHQGEIASIDKQVADYDKQIGALTSKEPPLVSLMGEHALAKNRAKLTGEPAGSTVMEYASIKAQKLRDKRDELIQQRNLHNRALAYGENNPMSVPVAEQKAQQQQQAGQPQQGQGQGLSPAAQQALQMLMQGLQQAK